MNNAAIPIIGKTKTWKDVKFVFNPMGHPPLVAGGQPTITAWIFGFMGVRSDDFPVNCLTAVTVEKLSSPEAIFKAITVMTDNFESFRNCRCLPEHPCDQHKDVVQRPS